MPISNLKTEIVENVQKKNSLQIEVGAYTVHGYKSSLTDTFSTFFHLI